MGNLYSDWCQREGRSIKDNYAFKCTAQSSGNDFLADFRGSKSSYFVATTVDLLTTGVDVPNVRNIVFFRYLKSPILMYQMLGRGTRLDEDKLLFRVFDYTDATRLLGEEFLTGLVKAREKAIIDGWDDDDDDDGEDDDPTKPQPQATGLDFDVEDAGHYVLARDEDGKHIKVPVEEYKRRTAEQLLLQAATIDKFRSVWIHPDERRELIDRLVAAGFSPEQLKTISGMVDYDTYDVLAELAYGLNPRKRQQRVDAFTYKHEEWLEEFPKETAETIKAIVEPFAVEGTEALENEKALEMPGVQKAGGFKALAATGKKPFEVLQEAKERLFSA